MTLNVTSVSMSTSIGARPIRHPARAQLADLTTPVSCGLAGLSLAQTKRKIRTIYCTEEYLTRSPSSHSRMIADEAGKTLADAIDRSIMALIEELDAKDVPTKKGPV